ncbi:MAG: efflux RND transporter permease subunit [Planctomycetota bacterium]
MLKTILFDNRHLLVLSLIVIVVSGLSAFINLPRLEDPRITNRNPNIITTLPGASAARVEALVTKKIETELRDIAEIKTLESSSRANVSSIQIELGDNVYNTQEIFTRIRDKLADIESELPENASKPDFDGDRGAVAFTLILGLTWEGDREQEMLNLLNRNAEELADRMRNIIGTDLVRIYGEPTEEITVELSRDKLAELGLSAGEVARRIGNADSKVASGTLRNSSSNLVMEVEGAFETTARIGNIPVAGSEGGQQVRLADIASVRKNWQDPPAEIAITDSKRGIYVAVRMSDDRRVDSWMHDANKVLDEFNATLSPSVQLTTVFEQQQYTSARLGALGMNLLMGCIVVVFVIFVMMGWRSSLLVGMALPLVAAMVLFTMQLLGIPLHQMSIFGLIVAIGLLIDNAIVVVDDVTSKIRDGESRRSAIAHTVQHLFVPLLGSTLTTVLAFLPIFLLPGSVGEFVGSIATTVILALIFSLLVSMTIIPALTGIFARIDQSKSFLNYGLQAPWFTRAYRSGLTYFLKHPMLGMLLAISIPLIGFLRAGELRNQFFPGADRNQFYVQVWTPPQTSIQATAKQADEIENEIMLDSRVTKVDWLIGGSMPTVFYNLVMDQDNTPNYAQGIITTDDAKSAEAIISGIQHRLDSKFPESQIIVRQLGQGPPIDAPIEIRVYGPEIARLKEIGRRMQNVLYQTPYVLHTRTTFDVSEPKIKIDADEAESQLAGLSLGDIAGQLQTGLEGTTGGSVLEQTEELPVRIRFGQDIRGDLNEIASTRLQLAGTNRWMPLSAVGKLRVDPETASIPRRNGERCNTVRAFVQPEALPPEVTSDFMNRLEASGFEMPAGYRLQVGGDSEELANSMASLFRYAPILGVLMFATLVLSFRSFILAGVLGGVAGLSAGIGFLTLWIAGFPLGFNPLIGIAGLIGLAINDSIVVLSQIRSNPRARAGDVNAIVDEVLTTGRHVVSTTLTTIGGFIPLLFAGGSFWPPLAIVIAGGVGGATILATLFIPSTYVLVRPWVEKDLTFETLPQQTPERLLEPYHESNQLEFTVTEAAATT